MSKIGVLFLGLVFASCAENPLLRNNGAFALLQQNGVRTLAPCKSTQPEPSCIYLGGIQEQTLEGIMSLKEECRCEIKIVRGTDDNRKDDTHRNGFAIDIADNETLSVFLRSKIKSAKPLQTDDFMYVLDLNEYAYRVIHEESWWHIVVVGKK